MAAAGEASAAVSPDRSADRLLSIVMPIRDEERSIARALTSLTKQEIPGWEIELIVAVGPSSDRTEAMVAQVASEDSRVRIVANPEGTAPSGLNRALPEARGSLVARADGHAEFAPGYFSTALEVLARTGASGVGGRAHYVGEGKVGTAIAAAMGSRLGGGGAAFRTATEECEADTLMFGLYRREVFDRVGEFDERLVRNQDDEWHHRGRLAGERFIVSPAMHFRQDTRSSFRALWRQHFEWGAYRAATLRKHRRFGAARQAAAPALVLALAAVATAELTRSSRRTALRSGVLGYAGGLAVGGYRTAVNAERPAAPSLVAAALATMHVGYGAGFWRELLAPRIRIG